MTEREWREASDMRRSTVLLAVIIIVAAVLRFWGLGSGLPHAPVDGEPDIMSRAVEMMRTGDYNPRVYDHPGLYVHIQFVVAVFRFVCGSVAGDWRSLSEAPAADFLLWGRAVTATLGTLTVLLTFQIGMRWGTRFALLAAGLIAVLPNHVRESHFVLTGVPLTFFVTLTFLLALRAHEQPRAPAFAWAGVTAGLAAATAYPGGLAVLLPITAAWMTAATRPSRSGAALASLAAAAVAFFAAAPYTVLDLQGFLNGFAGATSTYSTPGWIAPLRHLLASLQWPAFVLLWAGVALAAVRAAKGPGHVRWTLLLLFPLVHLAFVGRYAGGDPRHVLPLMPFICVLVACAVVSGVTLLRRYEIPRAARTALIAALTIAVLVPPALAAVRANREMTAASAPAVAWRWPQIVDLPR